MKVLLALALILSASSVRALDLEWKYGPELPSARDRLGCGMMSGMFIIVGGAYWEGGEKRYLSETIGYSPASGKWIRFPHIPRAGSYGASAVTRDRHGHEQLLIAGGSDQSGATSICYRLLKDGKSFEWKPLPGLPRAIAGAQGAVVGDRFYVFGGAPGLDEAGIRSAQPTLMGLEVPAVGGTNARWKELRLPGAPGARVGSAVAACGNRLCIFGGYGVQPDGTLGNFGDAYVLDLSRKTRQSWKRIADMPVSARWTTALALDERHVGLFGGYGEGFLDTALIYDTDQDRYLPAASMPRALAVMAGAVDPRGTVYLTGGEDKERHRSSAFLIGTTSGVE